MGHLWFAMGQLARQLKLDEGYRIVLNNGRQAGQEVPHLHFHVLAGRGFAGPRGSTLSPDRVCRSAGLRHQVLQQIRDQRGIVLLLQVVDVGLLHSQLLQMAGQILPVPFALLALGQVQFADEFLGPLERDRAAILVVVLDDPLLVP